MALFALKACQCHAEDPVLQLLPGHGGLASRGPPRTEQASRLTLGSSDEAPRQVLSGDARNIGDDSKAPKQSRSGDRHSEKNLEAPRQSLSGANRNSNEDSEADSRHKSSLSDSTASSSSGASGEQQRRLVRSAKIVISGMVEGFLRRKRSSEDYLRCAVPKVGNLAGAVLTSCAHTVNLIAKFLHVAQPIAPANRTTSAQTPYRVDDVDGATFLPGISQGLIEIIQLQGKLAAKCRNSQVIDSFELAATHLRNLSYVSGHLIANGADIVAELEDAAQAFELKDMRRFGVDIGGAWRKVLLSKVHLPDGASTKEAIKETSTGLIEGFFGSDLMLEIKTDRPRHSSGSSRHKQLHVDMEKCLQNENMRFFVEVWDATWIFFCTNRCIPKPIQRDKSKMAGSVVSSVCRDAWRFTSMWNQQGAGSHASRFTDCAQGPSFPHQHDEGETAQQGGFCGSKAGSERLVQKEMARFWRGHRQAPSTIGAARVPTEILCGQSGFA